MKTAGNGWKHVFEQRHQLRVKTVKISKSTLLNISTSWTCSCRPHAWSHPCHRQKAPRSPAVDLRAVSLHVHPQHYMTFEARTIDHVNFVQIHSVHHLQRELLAGSRFGLQSRYFKMQQVCVFLMFFDIFSSTLDPFFSPASLRFCSSPSGHWTKRVWGPMAS